MIRVYQYEYAYFEIVTHRERGLFFFIRKIKQGERFKKQYILFFIFYSFLFHLTLSL